jgi:hypothetical protein
MRRGAIRHTLALVLLAPLAHSQPSAPTNPVPVAPPLPPPLPPPLHVEYSAPGNCPTEAEFEAHIRSRTTLARFADDDDRDAQSVQVVVLPTGTTYAGHLSIVGRSGRVSKRDVEDTLCSDVVDALALVAALAVDPNAMLSPSGSAATPAPAEKAPVEGAAPDAVAVIPLVAPPPAAASPRPSARPPSRAPEADRSAPSPAPAWGVDVGATFIAMGGIAPDTLVGGGGLGEIESGSRRWLAPSARITLFAATIEATTTSTANFLLLAGRVDFCPLRIGSRYLSLRPCVAVDVGAVHAEAAIEGVAGAEPWFDAAALVRARWAPGRGRFFVELEGGIFVPVNHSSFVLKDGPVITTVDTPWWAGPMGSLATGMSFF